MIYSRKLKHDIIHNKMEQSIFPIEIWCEVSRHDYDVYRALKGLNKHFNKAISSVDIKGRFNYVHFSPDEKFNERMIDLFARLTVVNTGNNAVSIYKNGNICKSYRFTSAADVYNLKSISRYGIYPTRALYEYIGFYEYGVVGFHNDRIGYYNRHLRINDEDVCDEVVRPSKYEYTRHTPDFRERIAILPGTHAPFALNDAFFLYNPVV